MSEKFSWTAGFGRWWGIPFQVHLFFLLFAAVVFGVEWHYLGHAGNLSGTAIATVLVVFLLAIIHELAHGFAASTLGGQLNQLVITPWGGDSDILLPPSPREQLIVHSAGPFINAVIFAIGSLLLVLTNHSTLWELTNPLNPIPLRAGLIEISLMQITTWVSFQMLVVNLIPAFPFDAHRIIRSGVLSYNPRTPALRLENAMLVLGICSGLMAFLMAVLLSGHNEGPIQPTWFVLVVTGMLLIFSARYAYHVKVSEAQDELQLLDQYMQYDILGDDFDATESYLSEFEEDALADWLHDQQPGSEHAEKSVAVDEERRVDLILEKLHMEGIESLSDDERAFLNRISLQYRRRRELKS